MYCLQASSSSRTTECPDIETRCRPAAEPDSLEPVEWGLVAAVPVFMITAAVLLWVYCCVRSRSDRIASDAAQLRKIAPRHCFVLPRDDPLRGHVKKLCQENFRNSRLVRKLNVLNVAIVENFAMRKRYEQAYYQSSRLTRPQILSGRFKSARPPLDGFGKSAVAARFQPGVLRRGEIYVFCGVTENRVNALLTSRRRLLRLLNIAGGIHVANSLQLQADLSSEISSELSFGSAISYIIVVRATVETAPFAARHTFTNYNIRNGLPEFLVSLKRPAFYL